MPLGYYAPSIPETITVHLGTPDDTAAPNVEVEFTDYIKNVASSELYPTWPEEALRANILAQISYALNRIYLEWYRSRGYEFDITNTTQYDQAYVHDRNVFENISQLVDELFNTYIVSGERIEPFFAQFCNGTTSTCPGLSQWGSVDLAEQSMDALEILQYYYGDDIRLVEDAPLREITESYPGYPLFLGTAGNSVRSIQIKLNTIRQNYPAIPPITLADGIFGLDTEEAVRVFQDVFDLPVTGEVNKSTWYKIIYIYNSVKRLGELTSEGILLDDVRYIYPSSLQEGTWGTSVSVLQYFLNVIAHYNQNLPLLVIDSYFGPETLDAVIRFQEYYGLPADGIFTAEDWILLRQLYESVINNIPGGRVGEQAIVYPGYALTEGVSSDDVALFQGYLQVIGQNIPELPTVEITSVVDDQTLRAVNTLQQWFGMTLTNFIGHLTWYRISELYNSIIGAQTVPPEPED